MEVDAGPSAGVDIDEDQYEEEDEEGVEDDAFEEGMEDEGELDDTAGLGAQDEAEEELHDQLMNTASPSFRRP